MTVGYFQQAAAAAPAYPYGAHTQPGIDSRKAELLTGIKVMRSSDEQNDIHGQPKGFLESLYCTAAFVSSACQY